MISEVNSLTPRTSFKHKISLNPSAYYASIGRMHRGEEINKNVYNNYKSPLTSKRKSFLNVTTKKDK